jgi:hypothetical protein
VWTCLLFVVDCFNKKSAVAIISLKRKINLATKANKKNGGKAKLYFTLERKAAVRTIDCSFTFVFVKTWYSSACIFFTYLIFFYFQFWRRERKYGIGTKLDLDL